MSDREFILVFHEGENGPYEVRGRAFTIYRAAILIGHGRDHVRYEVLDDCRNVIPKDEFMEACLRDTGAIA